MRPGAISPKSVILWTWYVFSRCLDVWFIVHRGSPRTVNSLVLSGLSLWLLLVFNVAWQKTVMK